MLRILPGQILTLSGNIHANIKDNKKVQMSKFIPVAPPWLCEHVSLVIAHAEKISPCTLASIHGLDSSIDKRDNCVSRSVEWLIT